MKQKLLTLFAGFVWLIAGFMVTKIGVEAYSNLNSTAFRFIPLTVVIFILFYFKIFSPLVVKNINRIMELKDNEARLWRFLDKKSYIIMISMMSLGVVLRKFSNLPAIFFFVFYIGLGSALFLAGVKYFVIKDRRVENA